MPVPLVVIESPYRETVRPVLRYVRQLRREHPGDVISIIIPEYVVGALVAEPAAQPDRAAAEGAAAVRAVGDGHERAVGARRASRAMTAVEQQPVTYVRAEDLLDEPVPPPRAPRRRPRPAPAADRRWRSRALGLPLLTLLLDSTRDTLSLEGQVLLYLLAGGRGRGGRRHGRRGRLARSPPRCSSTTSSSSRCTRSTSAHGDQALALVVFLVVAAVVSGAVELAGAPRARRRAGRARRPRRCRRWPAPTSTSSETLRGVLERARETFGMESVALKARDHPTGEWVDVERAGWAPPGEEAPLRFDVPIGARPAAGRPRPGAVRRGPARAAAPSPPPRRPPTRAGA